MERRAQPPRRIGPYKRHELLTGEIVYPSEGYTGYGDGRGANLEDFISAEMRRDWAENRAALLKFWFSGDYTTIFPDTLPWLFVRGSPGTRPWAAEHLEEHEFEEA
jgi:hypothetical protein